MLKFWILAACLLLLASGCFEWTKTDSGQATLAKVVEVTDVVKDVAPAAGPIGSIVAVIAGLIGTGATALAETGRRRNRKALTAVVSGVQEAMGTVSSASGTLEASYLVDSLKRVQESTGTRKLVKVVLAKVNGNS